MSEASHSDSMPGGGSEDHRLRYRLITGVDDATFCERISGLLDQGYRLHGSPAVTFNGTEVIAAQALVWGKE
ncbi:DUF1737 domain-containing protein [Nocardia sp. NPDC005998]|uniref:DUF1737 domain-containing protein n=1 Tax=Nocardia sp. NPDC005998 TaxID=3156894 RepID=UPI0033A88DBE